MKKMKGIRSIAALMLAVMMTAGHASALTWYIDKGIVTIIVTVDETTKQKQVVMRHRGTRSPLMRRPAPLPR